MLLLFAGLVCFSACKDDELVTLDGILSHDGPNSTGPLLEVGTHEAAAKFENADLAAYEGQQLTKVEVFMGQAPAKTTVVVYGAGTANEPGAELYSADISSAVGGGNWVKHTLSTPIDVDGTDLWLAVRLEHTVEQQSIGCDAGPRENNGDWLYKSTDGNWETYVDRTSESVNWNIRGTVE